MYKLMYDLAIVNKYYVTVSLGWHDSILQLPKDAQPMKQFSTGSSLYLSHDVASGSGITPYMNK